DDRLVWIDCEMTGLDVVSDALVEIACVVTGPDLAPVHEGFTTVIKPPARAAESMDDVVVNMHTESGLINEFAAGITIEAAQLELMEYLKDQGVEEKRSPLCGSSVYVDRGFLARDMPELDAYLHYRLIDVSSLKELARRWYPRVYYSSPRKTGNHRALGDILDSIAELRYYRDAMMVGQPGPDSTAARMIAEQHQQPLAP
ncbi:MAG: oligoribonuclease, partial [Candidatus Nanopelagicales bacterium]